MKPRILFIAVVIIIATVILGPRRAFAQTRISSSPGIPEESDCYGTVPTRTDAIWIPRDARNAYLSIAASPNPVQYGDQSVTVNGLNVAMAKHVTLRIIDVLGRTVFDLSDRVKIDQTLSTATASYSANEIPAGSFFLCFQSGSDGALCLVYVIPGE